MGDKRDYLQSRSAFGFVFDKHSLRFYELNFAFLAPKYTFGSRIENDTVRVKALNTAGLLRDSHFGLTDYKQSFRLLSLSTASADISLLYFIVSAVFLGLFALIYFRKRSKTPIVEALQKTNSNLQIEELRRYNNELLDAPKLQSILNLNYDNVDTMRVKMNAEIKAINAEYPNAIERVKSNEDSRVFSYRISIK